MNPKDKKFQDALVRIKLNNILKQKDYDNNDFKVCKKKCEKILEKTPKNQEAMALKGLSLLGLKDKENAEKLIKDSLKLGFKNAICWHFYAIFNKETKNYSQSIKCYLQSHKNDPENYNVLRDLSYLEIYFKN